MATKPNEPTNELALVEAGTISVEAINELAQAIREEIGEMGPLELPRAVMPTGGTTLSWGLKQSADDQRPTSHDALEGVIIARHQTYAYFSNPQPVPGTRPDCASRDGVHGISAQGDVIVCETCPYNQFKSAVKSDGSQGDGKACRNAWTLYLLRPGEVLPTRVKIPPTGMKALKNYIQSLIVPKNGRPMLRLGDVMTRITLDMARSNAGTQYATPAFEAIAILPKESAAALQQYGKAFTIPVAIPTAAVAPEDGEVF